MKGSIGTKLRTDGSARWALINQRQAYQNRKLNGRIWSANCAAAKRTAKLRWARDNQEGLEKSHALTDIHRNIIKKAMMTTREAYIRNKTTKQYGLFWVICG